MTFEDFQQLLSEERLPSNLSDSLRVLWYDGKGNWNAAHDLAQDMSGSNGALLHAYLHRKEGDRWNANYWYRRAGRSFPEMSLDEEWEEMVKVYIRLVDI